MFAIIITLPVQAAISTQREARPLPGRRDSGSRLLATPPKRCRINKRVAVDGKKSTAEARGNFGLRRGGSRLVRGCPNLESVRPGDLPELLQVGLSRRRRKRPCLRRLSDLFEERRDAAAAVDDEELCGLLGRVLKPLRGPLRKVEHGARPRILGQIPEMETERSLQDVGDFVAVVDVRRGAQDGPRRDRKSVV